MRAIVTGPGKSRRPAALSFGSKMMPANKDGTFNLTTANLVDLYRRGYQVDPVRAKRVRNPVVRDRRPVTISRLSSQPTIPISLYRADVRR